MADKKFGVKQIDLIGASGTPTLTSPNNLNINSINVAISTDLSVGGDVSIGGTFNALSVSGVSTTTDLKAQQLNVSGVTTFSSGGTRVQIGLTTAVVVPAGIIQVGSSAQDGTLLKGGEINLTGPNSTDVNSTYYSNIRLNRIGSNFRYDLEFHSNGYSSSDIGDFIFYRRGSSYQRFERMRLNGETGKLTVTGGGSFGSNLDVSGITSATTLYGDASRAVSGKWTLGANGTSNYTFDGVGVNAGNNYNTPMYLARGCVYEFVNNSGGSHPFQIRVSNGGAAYSTGVTNNGASSGTIRFEVPMDAPNSLYYQCTSHSGMGGTITVYPDAVV